MAFSQPGTYRVNIDLPPATYHTDGGSSTPDCFWARLSTVTPNPTPENVIASAEHAGRSGHSYHPADRRRLLHVRVRGLVLGVAPGGVRATLGHLGAGARRLVTGELGVLALAGLAWVLLAPEVATALPYGGRPEPNAAQVALTAAGLISFTYLYVRRTAFRLRDRSHLVLLFWGYNAMIVAIKFILSPSAYRSTTTTSSLGEFVSVGLVAMVFYVLGLMVVHATATRGRSWASKAMVVAALVVLALVARWVAAVVLGAAGDAYFEHLYRGLGTDTGRAGGGHRPPGGGGLRPGRRPGPGPGGRVRPDPPLPRALGRLHVRAVRLTLFSTSEGVLTRMTDRPPVLRPEQEAGRRSVLAEVAVAICIAAGLLFLGFTIFMAYALRQLREQQVTPGGRRRLVVMMLRPPVALALVSFAGLGMAQASGRDPSAQGA